MSESFRTFNTERGGIRSLVSAAVICLFLFALDAFSRTIIVAQDGSGEFEHVPQACDSASTGDTVLIRPGIYEEWATICVDSAVVVLAEQPGTVTVFGFPDIDKVRMTGSAELRGISLIGNWMGISEQMVVVEGGRAALVNCEIIGAARRGVDISARCDGLQPLIVNCRLAWVPGFYHVMNWDSTNLVIPNNYFDTVDTTLIHLNILDGGRDSTLGFVTISPVLDHFQWLAAEDQPHSRRASSSATLLQVYPNPSTGAFHLNLSGTGRVELYDLLGRCVWQVDAKTIGALQMPEANNLSAGTYFLRFRPQHTSQNEQVTAVLRITK